MSKPAKDKPPDCSQCGGLGLYPAWKTMEHDGGAPVWDGDRCDACNGTGEVSGDAQ